MDSNIHSNIDPYIDGKSSTTTVSEHESWKNMAQRFYTDVSALIEREGQLIRAELSEKATQIKAASISLFVGATFVIAGLFCLAATAIIMLNLVTQLWIASVIVTVAFLLIGGILLIGAKNKLEADKLKPTKSIEAFSDIQNSLKEKVYEITKH
jgi:uncharacterized membrane protein YqjE